MNAQEATQTALFHTASSSYPHAVAPTPFTQSSLNSRSAAASYLPGAMFTSGYYAEGAGVRGNEAAVQPLLMQAPPRASDAEPRSYAGFNPSNASSATNAAAAQYYPPNMLSMMGSASGQPLMGLMPYAHYYQYNQQNHQNGGAQNALSDYYASYNSALGTTSNAAGPAGAETPRAVASDSGAAVSTLASGSHYPNFPISPPGFYPASMNINVSMKMNLIGIQQPNSPMEVCGAATTAPPTSGPPAALYPTGYSGADAICSNSAPSSSGNGSDLLARSYQMLNSWKTPAAAAASPKSNAYCTNESLAYWYSCGGAYPAELGATADGQRAGAPAFEAEATGAYRLRAKCEPLMARQESGGCKKSNACRICGKFYARPSTLKIHMRTHSGERPHMCSVCKKTFSQAANLSAHLRIHSGEKPFKCHVCDRKFSQSSSVTTHMRTHSGDRPYHCVMCRKSFADSSTLTKHMRVHTGDKPYQCKTCSMRFSQSGNLSRHMKVHLESGFPL